MKSELIEAVPPKEELKFPLLAKSKIGQIVLFTGPKTGTKLSADRHGYQFGHHLDTWVDCTESDTWTILPPGTKLVLEV